MFDDGEHYDNEAPKKKMMAKTCYPKNWAEGQISQVLGGFSFQILDVKGSYFYTPKVETYLETLSQLLSK